MERQYKEKVAQLDGWMEGGRQYSRAVAAGHAARDLALEAMAKVVNREMPVLLEANGERDIRNAVEWAQRQDIRFVLTGGREAWRIAPWLAERNVPLILGPTQAKPNGPDAAYDEAYEAAMAVPFGLPREAALEAVMKNAAEMLGLGDRMGTIEPGKIANLIVTDGDPLEIQTQILDLVMLKRQVSTDNKHKALYEKYRARPKERIVS